MSVTCVTAVAVVGHLVHLGDRRSLLKRKYPYEYLALAMILLRAWDKSLTVSRKAFAVGSKLRRAAGRVRERVRRTDFEAQPLIAARWRAPTSSRDDDKYPDGY